MFNSTFDRVRELSKKETMSNYERAQLLFTRFQANNPDAIPDQIKLPDRDRGREIGRHWAVRTATPGQLDWLQRTALKDPEDISIEEEFWSTLPDITEADRELVKTADFREGFREAALQVWKLFKR